MGLPLYLAAGGLYAGMRPAALEVQPSPWCEHKPPEKWSEPGGSPHTDPAKAAVLRGGQGWGRWPHFSAEVKG